MYTVSTQTCIRVNSAALPPTLPCLVSTLPQELSRTFANHPGSSGNGSSTSFRAGATAGKVEQRATRTLAFTEVVT